MPLETRYDVESRLIWIIGKGSVSMEERVECVKQILSNSAFESDSNILINVNRIQNAPREQELMAVAHLIQILRSRFSGRVGIVNLQAGHVTLSHLIAISSDISGNSVQVFFSDDEALAWFKE